MLDVGLEPSGQQKAPSGNLGKLVNFTYASRLPKGRSLCFWLFSESPADIRIYFWSNFIITHFLLPKWHSWQSPYPSVLNFWWIKLEKLSLTNWNFSLFQTKVTLVLHKVGWADPWIVTITKQESAHATLHLALKRLYFKLDFYCLCSLQKSTLKLIFQVKNPVRRTRFFKNQIQMVRANVALFLTQNESLHLLLWAVLSALRNSCLTFLSVGKRQMVFLGKAPVRNVVGHFVPEIFNPKLQPHTFQGRTFGWNHSGWIIHPLWLKLKIPGLKWPSNPRIRIFQAQRTETFMVEKSLLKISV